MPYIVAFGQAIKVSASLSHADRSHAISYDRNTGDARLVELPDESPVASKKIVAGMTFDQFSTYMEWNGISVVSYVRSVGARNMVVAVVSASGGESPSVVVKKFRSAKIPPDHFWQDAGVPRPS